MDWLTDDGNDLIDFVRTAPKAQLAALLAESDFDALNQLAPRDPRAVRTTVLTIKAGLAQGTEYLASEMQPLFALTLAADRVLPGNYEEMPLAA